MSDLGIAGCERIEEIGRGGFAVVYRAWQPAFERHVAIKVLTSTLDEPTLQRFERECAAIGALSGHPHIVTVHDLGRTAEGRPFILMEYLDGGPLSDRIEQQGALSWIDAVATGIKVAGALESAHRRDVLHRDIKPENVLVSRFGEPKLGDFGIARVQGRHETRSGIVTATPAHAPPEIINGAKATVEADVYSLASTIHALIGGRAPFVLPDDESMIPIYARIATEPPPDLRLMGVPDEVCRVIEQAMSKEAEERQGGAADLARQLRRAQEATGQRITDLVIETDAPGGTAADASRTRARVRPSAARAPSSPRREPEAPPLPPPAGKSRAPIAVAVIVAVAVLAAAGAFLTLGRDDAGSATATTLTTAEDATDSTAVPAGKDIFRDDFSAGGNGWGASDTEVDTIGIVNGEYHLTAKVEMFPSFAVFGPADPIRDVVVEADAKRLSEPGGRFGTVCRYGTVDHNETYVAGLVDDSGGWSIVVKPLGQPLQTVSSGLVPEWAPISPHRVGLACDRSTARLTIDGQQAGEGELPDVPDQGIWGFMVMPTQPGVSVAFDNLVVSRP